MNESISHTGCKGNIEGDIDREGNHINSSYFNSIKNMIGACSYVPGIMIFPSVGGGRLWSLQVLNATTKATAQDSTEGGKTCGAFMQYQMAALLTGEINVTRPIRSAITLSYVQMSSYSEGGNTKHEYWLWVDPWNHVRSGDLTGTTMKGVKHGYYSRSQSDYNPLDYYYYYDHVHYTVADRWSGAGRAWEQEFEKRLVTVAEHFSVIHRSQRTSMEYNMAWSRKNGKNLKNPQASYTWWRGVKPYAPVPEHGYYGASSLQHLIQSLLPDIHT